MEHFSQLGIELKPNSHTPRKIFSFNYLALCISNKIILKIIRHVNSTNLMQTHYEVKIIEQIFRNKNMSRSENRRKAEKREHEQVEK